MWGGWKWKVRLGVWIDEGKFVGFVCVLVCVCGGMQSSFVLSRWFEYYCATAGLGSCGMS